MNNEQGRSLTEMLGMLAIIGILSVAGVAMYNSAMNKHRANELIYEAQKRATTVAMQITAGRDTLSIGEFTNPTGYVFDVEKNPNNANQFNITLDAVPSDICTQMKTVVGDSTVLRVISNDCTKLTFNNDLSTKQYASDNQTQEACEDAGNTWCTKGDNGAGVKCAEGTGADCCAGVEYDHQCQKCTAGTGEISSTNENSSCSRSVWNAETQQYEPGAGVCRSGVCVNPDVENGKVCTTNDDCGGTGSGYYCQITYNAADNLNGNLNDTNTECYKNLKGTCTVAPRPTHLTAGEKAFLINSGFSTSTIIGPRLNWWSANNWCEVQGKHLLDVKTMGCYRNGNSLVKAGQRWGYCCKQGQSCQQSSWHTTLWNGKNVLPDKAEEVAKFANKIVALRKILIMTFWMASPYGNSSENSCYAFDVNTGDGSANAYYRTYDSYFALCE